MNGAAVGACGLLRERGDLQMLLLTGRAHIDRVAAQLPREGDLLVRALPFLDRMELAYSVADLVVARAGAATIAEVTSCGLPSLLVPYPHATGHHQERNARAVQRAGGASVLRDDALSPETLATRTEGLIDHDERLQAMAAAATSWSRPDAADVLAELVLEKAKRAS